MELGELFSDMRPLKIRFKESLFRHLARRRLRNEFSLMAYFYKVIVKVLVLYYFCVALM